MLARAFHDYPLFLFFFPDEAERTSMAPVIFRGLLRYALRYGEIYATSEQLEGAAVWLPSGVVRPTLWRNLMIGNLSGIASKWRQRDLRRQAFDEYAALMHRRCAPSPHLYLQLLGVEPANQGKGCTGRLLNSMFARIDGLNLPCYLMTQKEKNVSIYRHFGFEVKEQSEFPGSGVTTWAMLKGKAE
jgi:GNAT superfamily N-acetyltransferase